MKPVFTLTIAFLLALVGVLPAVAAGEITVDGGGWGHGIGMSQYGAQALANQGESAQEITAHFYSGSSIGNVGQGAVTGHPDPLRIGVGQKMTFVEFSPVGGALQLCLGTQCASAAAGVVHSFRYTPSGTCQFWRGPNPILSGACNGSINVSPTVRASFPAFNRQYGRGQILFVPAAGSFHLLVQVTLEQYLYGLGEMPSSWHIEALKAQAIAGRTYAVQKAWTYRDPNSATTQNRMAACGCHLYATTLDQAYVGWAKEGEGNGWGPRWRSAVDATAGQVVIHPSTAGRAIEAYYFSATGGRTENNEDVWGGTARSYLRSVVDPGSRKWSAWGDPPETFSKAQFAAELGFSSVWSAQFGSRYVSGSPASVVVTGVKGGVTTSQSFSGNQLRTLLGLRSHYVTSITGFLPSSFTHFVEGDFDGDNKDETAAFSAVDGSWWVFDKSGAELIGRPFANASPGGWTRVVSGDFNGDDLTDVAMYHGSTGAWWVGVSNGSKFTFVRWALFSTKTGWSPQAVGDFNGDGRDDIANYHAASGNWWVSRSTGSGFSTALWTSFSTRSGWKTHIVGDFNGDGSDDLASFHPSNGTWWVSRSTGGAFTTTKWADFTTASGWSTQITGDFNADGRDDIANFYPGSGSWWVSTSSGSALTTSKWADYTTNTGWGPQLVGDFDKDGRADIANFHSSNGAWWVSRSTGSLFTTSLRGSLSPATGWSGQMTGDFDGDGDSDLSNYYSGNRTWWVK